MRPNCRCGHSYEKHSWGTTGCSECPDHCHIYQQSFCSCGHVWESHAIIDGKPDVIACPFCNKECLHWGVEKMHQQAKTVAEKAIDAIDVKPIYSPAPNEKCGFCKHEYSKHGKDQEGNFCNGCQAEHGSFEFCAGFTTQTIEEICECGHPKTDHQTEDGHSWCDGCASSNIPVRDMCSGFKEFEEHPDCECGHPYYSHTLIAEDENLSTGECTECFEDYNIPLSTTCKKYVPKPLTVTEFEEANKAALAQINKGTTAPAVSSPHCQQSWWGQQQTFITKCNHKPFLAYEENGGEVWVGTRYACLDYITQFDVILNCTNAGATMPEHKIPLPFGHKYETSGVTEVELDWPDMGIPGGDVPLAAEFWLDLLNYIRDEKKKLLIFCIGGHGRTGTALACLLVANGWSFRKAKKWIKKEYCSNAIESTKQEGYIKSVEKGLHKD